MRTSEGAAEACLEAYQALGHKSLINSVRVIILKLLKRLFKTINSGSKIILLFIDYTMNDIVIYFLLNDGNIDEI